MKIHDRCVSRAVCIVLALFPALWGLFSLLNNVSGFSSTAMYAVKPMLAMEGNYGGDAFTWRAITFSSAPTLGLIFITTCEAIAGFLATFGIIKMLKNFKGSYDDFNQGKLFVILGALMATFIWGIVFMVIAGDWFMSWQVSNNPLMTQIGGAIYAIPNLFVLTILMNYKEHA